MIRLSNAIILATAAHDGQYRKYGNKIPYFTHPVRVAMKTWGVTKENIVATAAAFLHDVLEDTPTPPSAISSKCGEDVLKIVQELTNPSKLWEHCKKPRAERKRIDREHIQSVSWSAKVIKLCDRIDNLKDISEGPKDFQTLYARESVLLLEALSGTNNILEKEMAQLIEALLQ